MQNVPVVVDQVFQSDAQKKCSFCHSGLIEYGPNFCKACGSPQPAHSSEDSFQVMLMPRRFVQSEEDLKVLEANFYKLSLLLHPDRYMKATRMIQSFSTERMSVVNEAYSSLKNPALRRKLLLKLYGYKAHENSQSIPFEIAEQWFELQEALSESQSNHLLNVKEKVVTFREELKATQQQIEKNLQALEMRLDEAGVGSNEFNEGLCQFAQDVEKQNYLVSLQKNLQKNL